MYAFKIQREHFQINSNETILGLFLLVYYSEYTNRTSRPAFTPQPQIIATVWPVLISRPAEGRRLTWPGWLVTYRDDNYARPKTVIHPSTNRAGCTVSTVTSLIRPTSFLLRHTAIVIF